MINDNSTGFDAIKINAFLPYNFEVDLLGIKIPEEEGTVLGEWNRDAFGFFLRKKWKNYIFQFLNFYERDKTVPKGNRYFLGGRVDSSPKKGISYKGEMIWRRGKKFRGVGYLFGIDFEARTKIGKGKLIFEYLGSTGDKDLLDEEKNEAFSPLLSHLSEEEYGEYFMSTYQKINPFADPIEVVRYPYKPGDLAISKIGLFVSPVKNMSRCRSVEPLAEGGGVSAGDAALAQLLGRDTDRSSDGRHRPAEVPPGIRADFARIQICAIRRYRQPESGGNGQYLFDYDRTDSGRRRCEYAS